jgi:hypothetical protein
MFSALALPTRLSPRQRAGDQYPHWTLYCREQIMLAEIFMLRLEATARVTANGQTTSPSRFVPVALKAKESK